MAGVSSGPTPWWQLPGGQAARTNLEGSAPSGYEYNPVDMGYERTPASVGSRMNTALSGLMGLGGGTGMSGGTNGSLPNFSAGAGGGNTGGSPSAPRSLSTVPGAMMPASSGAASPAPSMASLDGVAPVTPGARSNIAAPNFASANTAAFATAKDHAANTARAALTGLAGELQGRGMGGGGYEAGQVGATLGREANTIGEADRAESIHEADLNAAAEGLRYQGDITQRGQDLSAQEGNANRNASLASTRYSGDITQRGQNISAEQEAANRLAGIETANMGAGVAQRGQDLSLALGGMSNDATLRGQDLSASEGNANRNATLYDSAANRNSAAAMEAQRQRLALLTSALGKL